MHRRKTNWAVGEQAWSRLSKAEKHKYTDDAQAPSTKVRSKIDGKFLPQTPEKKVGLRDVLDLSTPEAKTTA